MTEGVRPRKLLGSYFEKSLSSEATQAPHGTTEMLTLERGWRGASEWAMDHAPLGSTPGLHRLESSSRGDQDRATPERVSWEPDMKKRGPFAGSDGLATPFPGGLRELERGKDPWRQIWARGLWLTLEEALALLPGMSRGRAPAGGARAQRLRGAGLRERRTGYWGVPLRALGPQQTLRLRTMDFCSKHSRPVTSSY